jgi:hypothetical protein
MHDNVSLMHLLKPYWPYAVLLLLVPLAWLWLWQPLLSRLFDHRTSAPSRAEQVIGQPVTPEDMARAGQIPMQEGGLRKELTHDPQGLKYMTPCPRAVLRAELLTDPVMMGYAPYVATGNYRQLAILLMTRQEGAQFRIQDGETERQGSRAEVLCARPGQVISKEEISVALTEE